MDRGQLQNDPELALRSALDGRQAQIWTTMPGIVTQVRWDEMTVDVQPAIKAQVTDENGLVTYVNYPVLIHCPIVFPSTKEFALTMPIVVGDEVLVSFSARCIDAWWQQGGIQAAAEFRMHDLSDGFAIPGPHSQPNVFPSVSATAAQLRNKAGTSYVEISASGEIKIKAPTVTIDGNLVATGTIKGSTNIDLVTHKHGGVTTGGGTSGIPVP